MSILRQELINFLRQHPLTKGWSKADVEKLADEAELKEYAESQVIFDAYTQADDAYVVYDGEVRQAILSPNREEWWSVVHRKGDYFAHQALFRGRGYASTAQAIKPSLVLRVPAALFAELLTKYPDLWSVVQSPAAARLQAVPLLRSLDDDQIQQLATRVTTHEFKPGQTICQADDAEGYLWIVDQGQVRVTAQRETMVVGGKPTTVAASPQVVAEQGFAQLPAILTAGNWFIGGALGIPGLVTVTAEALTKVKLIRMQPLEVQQLLVRFPDFDYMLHHRLDVAGRLREALSREALFLPATAEHKEPVEHHGHQGHRGLTDAHWHALASVAGWEHVPANLDVTRQGQHGTKLYVLTAGRALVRATDEKGRERPRHTIAIGQGDVYGLRALVSGDRHTATVRSIVQPSNGDGQPPLDGSDWLTLQHDDVLYLLHSRPDLWEGTPLWAAMMIKPKEKRFRWQGDEEEILVVTRRHVLYLILRIVAVAVLALLVVGGLAVLLEFLPGGPMTPLAGLLAFGVIFLPLLAWYVVDYFNDYYVITDRRILRHDRVLLIYENQLEAPIERIQDVSRRSSLIAKIFNYGWMTISQAGAGSIAFDMVPDPERIESLIRQLQGEVRASTQAEQRENLRNKLLSSLRMRLIPAIPGRSLPDDTKLPVRKTAWQRLVEAVVNPIRFVWRALASLPENLYLLFLQLLPKRAREQTIKERQARKRKRATEFQDQIVYRKHILFLVKDAIIPLVFVTGTVVLWVLTDFTIRGLPGALSAVYAVFLAVALFWLWFRWENWRNDRYVLTKTHIYYIYALPLGLSERRR
ncbi:MAG: cyclic nucleotide-binding domain-containing protein, partial [Caldilineales bacterium]|nr:cyclic nucleotide-binding domain-containing protein [Caldilineales bacterium]